MLFATGQHFAQVVDENVDKESSWHIFEMNNIAGVNGGGVIDPK